jgi:hypothetical protein
MAADPSAKTPATTVPAVSETHAVDADIPVAGVSDRVCWEFRLTADRRRILVLVNQTADPEFG